MSKFMTKASNALTSAKFKTFGLAHAACSAMYTTQAFAGNVSGEQQGASLVETVLDTLVGIFPWIGAFLLFFGAFKVVMAIRNDNPQDQATGARDIVIGAVLIIFRAFLWNVIKNEIFV